MASHDRSFGDLLATLDTVPMPPHEDSVDHINTEQCRAIEQLSRAYSNNKGLMTHLEVAHRYCQESVLEINESHQRKAERRKRRAEQREQRGEEPSADDLDTLDAQRALVTGMTAEGESKIRLICDLKSHLASMEDSLKEVGAQARARAALPTSTDNTDDSRNVDAAQLFMSGVNTRQEEYMSLAMQSRYATNETYKDFRHQLHDAQFVTVEAPPPVPPASSWFSDSGPVLTPANNPESAADEDVKVASEIKSLTCPITLLVFGDPVTSTKCPHSFERSAINDMIQQSGARSGGSRRGEGTKVVQCPCCAAMLSLHDLKADPVLLRRVQRTKRKEQGGAEEQDDEYNSHEEERDIDHGSRNQTKNQIKIEAAGTERVSQSRESRGNKSESDISMADESS